MTLTITPIEFEIHEGTSLVATVKMMDECGAKVEINWLCNRTSFDKFVPYIQQALSAMELAGDK